MIITTYENFLNVIVREKERKQLTAKYLAELVSVTPHTMSKYLYQDVQMPADIMFALLQVLGYRLELNLK